MENIYRKTLLLVGIISFFSLSCISQEKIGKQVWMIKNLDVDRFRNGDLIPEARSIEDWIEAGEKKMAVWGYYEYNPLNGEKYGKLYNWYAVTDSRGLGPSGWHIPSDAEWNILIEHLGGAKKAGTKLKSKTGWYSPPKSIGGEGNGSNSSGFSGLPGGSTGPKGSTGLGEVGTWWSSTKNDNNTAWGPALFYFSGSVGRGSNDKSSGFSVRCVMD